MPQHEKCSDSIKLILYILLIKIEPNKKRILLNLILCFIREALEEYAREVEKLAYTLLELISLSLGLAADQFHGCFKDQMSMVRLNHYPPCPFPDLALGVGHHKDAGALTVLAQDDVGGLQVKRKSDGEWIPVKPTPDAFIINVGDIVQVCCYYIMLYSSVEYNKIGSIGSLRVYDNHGFK